LPSLRDLLEVAWGLPADISADGGTVLVLWNATGTLQLHRAPWAGGELERLTDFAEPVDGRFVGDTGRILLRRDEGGNERHQLFLLDAEPGAEPEPLVVEPDFLHVTPELSHDGRLLAYACNRRNGVDLDVFVRDLRTGEERTVFAPGGYCEVGGFSPDARHLTVLRLTERTGDNDLHVLDLETGESVHVAPEEEDAAFDVPVWLPGGDAFLFATSSGRDTIGIARYELATGAWRYVLEGPWDLRCRLDRAGRTLVVAANEEGSTRLELRDPETLELRRGLELPGRGVVESTVLSRDGRRLAYGFSSPRIPWSVWLADTETGETRRLTPPSDTVDEGALVDPSVERYASFDGESIPVFLFQPNGAERPPVVVEIHGGPEAQRQLVWMPLVQYLVASGYAVAQPNVRGSTGYGKRYEHLDDVRLRLDSVRDLVALHDRLGEDGRYDTGRVVLYGGSYGGYMTLAGLAFHPDRWAAGIAVVPVSSFVTFLENTSEWRRAFREREYGSLERDRGFLEEVSPITRVDRIRAPLFLIHGANDPRVPLGEAEQIHAALRERGIRTELLVYPDEGHGLNKLKNRLDAYPKAVAFLAEVLGRPTNAENGSNQGP
jgi:dipeptidyl aminopeptidase/acylaminoacyl peptidase